MAQSAGSLWLANVMTCESAREEETCTCARHLAPRRRFRSLDPLGPGDSGAEAGAREASGTRSRLPIAPAPARAGQAKHAEEPAPSPEPARVKFMVGRRGIEPRTLGLRVPCSAS